MPSKIRESLTDMIFKPLSKFEGKKRMFPEDQKNMKILIENYMSKKVTKPEISLSEVPKKIQTNDIHHKKNGS